MSWRLPYVVRLVGVTMALISLATICAPSEALGAQVGLVEWLSAAAAPALQAAAPTNDPLLAARETLNRGIAGAISQLRRISPGWLQGVEVNVSFDPTFQPRYALSASQPLLRTVDGDIAIDLHGGVIHDTAGRTGGNLGFRFTDRVGDQPFGFGLTGAIENRWLQAVERYTIKVELRLSLLEIHASLFDEVPESPLSQRIAARRLDGYDLQVNLHLPRSSWVWLQVYRSWQMAAGSDSQIIRDRISLRPLPLAPLEIETGTQSQGEVRSWSAQLRWRISLGG
jgi:hypothetical protein